MTQISAQGHKTETHKKPKHLKIREQERNQKRRENKGPFKKC